jgi:carbon storage regulator
MLILTRKIGERIHIADNIVVTVVQVHGRTVRLGLEAPANVPILRHELARHSLAAEIVSPRQAFLSLE